MKKILLSALLTVLVTTTQLQASERGFTDHSGRRFEDKVDWEIQSDIRVCVNRELGRIWADLGKPPVNVPKQQKLLADVYTRCDASKETAKSFAEEHAALNAQLNLFLLSALQSNR